MESKVIKWPHAPSHIFNENGTYMITGATLYKKHIFNTPEKLNLLQNNLFDLAMKFDWNLQAWAIFSNHYHFIFYSDMPTDIGKFIKNFHGRMSYLINKEDNTPGRVVWYQYRETRLTHQKSHYARLNYVINNPVKHKLVYVAHDYQWCSASWFEKTAERNFVEAINSFKTDMLDMDDDY
jgi:putative transposase